MASTTQAMLHQEHKFYVRKDYLHQLPDFSSNMKEIDVVCPLRLQEFVERELASHREEMVDSCYQIADFFHVDHETVAIALNYFDRFVITQVGSQARDDPQFFRLAFLTALYTAVKIHTPIAINPQTISKLSHFDFTGDEVELMEGKMLQALKWRVNPPTEIAFVRQFLEVLPFNDITIKENIFELAKFQIELAIRDERSLALKSSIIALAALINAIESVCPETATIECIGNHLASVTNIEWDSKYFGDVQEFLCSNAIEMSCDCCKVDTLDDQRQGTISKGCDNATKSCHQIIAMEESPRSLSKNMCS